MIATLAIKSKVTTPSQSQLLPRRSTQSTLLALGILAAIALVYASIVPLHFTPRPMDEAIARFWRIPWLQLDIYRRADWVANGIVAMPFGFLLAGAADWERRTTLSYIMLLGVIIILGQTLIVAIEFIQIWFPPRTVSSNDILAGVIGATLGPILWPFLGRPAARTWEQLRQTPWNRFTSPKIGRWLLVAFCVVVAAYSIMPLDLMLNAQEWSDKWAAGRFRLIPNLADEGSFSATSFFRFIIALVLSAARMVPLGILVFAAKLDRKGMALLIGFPIFIELIQAPIFTRYAVFSDVVCGWTGGLFGFFIASNSTTIMNWNQRVLLRLCMVLAAWLASLVAFLSRYDRIRSDAEVTEVWSEFWAFPFAKYYYTSEFSAGSNFAGKIIIFAIFGFLLANLFSWKEGKLIKPSRFGIAMAAFLVVGTGAAIELAQIYLHPLIADASDVAIYSLGGFFGWATYRTLATWNLGSARTDLTAKPIHAAQTLDALR